MSLLCSYGSILNERFDVRFVPQPIGIAEFKGLVKNFTQRAFKDTLAGFFQETDEPICENARKQTGKV